MAPAVHSSGGEQQVEGQPGQQELVHGGRGHRKDGVGLGQGTGSGGGTHSLPLGSQVCCGKKRVWAACMEAPALRQQQFALHVGRLQLRVGETGAWLGTRRG